MCSLPEYKEKDNEALKQKYIKAIVVFEIEVSALDLVFKLSQDRDADS